jgi:LuxR family transcriptional regulator, quorum-sensing system regulator SdiA
LIDVMGDSGHLVCLLGPQLHGHVIARALERMNWAADGLTTEQIADRLSLSAATVNYHFNKIVLKFDAANRHHAAIKAIRLGLI